MDESIEDYGNKWSLSALLQHLEHRGPALDLLLRQAIDVNAA